MSGYYIFKFEKVLVILRKFCGSFGAATAFQYSADHKKTVKNHNFTSMCLYVSMLSYTKKSLFQNTFFAVTFLFLIRF